MSTDSSEPTALEVRGLDAFYGKQQVVFSLDLDLQRGETLALLGRNGAAKTTFFMALLGLVSAKARSLRLCHTDLRGLAPHRRVRAGLSIVPSGSRAFPSLTIEENLSVPVAVDADGAQPWTVERVYETFPTLWPMRRVLAGSLSGGERQMLALGRALLTTPKVLLLDEPSEGLAPPVVRQLVGAIERLKAEGLAIILTEHNYRLALEMADRAYFVEKGRRVWEGTVQDARAPEVVGLYLGV